ncbi:hypothetical protein [Spirobacillus cienkowskii]|uniref:hypothetical protein n=1 Tax=Spirobacillus cienkowskii TaxID=495820 RepID=UPI0030D079C7
MTFDQEIYLEISRNLLNINNYRIESGNCICYVKMKAELVSSNDVCKFKFEILDKNKNRIDATLDGVTSLKILRMLSTLREFFLKNNQPYWKGCNFEVNLEAGSYEVNFVYE